MLFVISKLFVCLFVAVMLEARMPNSFCADISSGPFSSLAGAIVMRSLARYYTIIRCLKVISEKSQSGGERGL